MSMNLLKNKILNKKAKLSVIGLGYVGLPLAVEFAKRGFEVFGIDNDKRKIKSINEGISYIGDVSTEELKRLVKNKKFKAVNDAKVVKKSDVIIICVPTPLGKTREPDISFILKAVKSIRDNIKKGSLIVLESTTYPGTTREVIQSMLEEVNLKLDKDFYLAFSPERVDPANPRYKTFNIPKVVGGLSRKSTSLAQALYQQIVSEVIPVSSSEVAEMVKLLENTFRIVNIGLVNEIAMMCGRLKIDVWEVIKAASTKPFGFMPFYPGPGIGGHCIGIDPLYLSWRARHFGFEARFIELASQINAMMPHHVVELITNALNSKGKAITSAKILIIGVAYKKDVSDVRESPALEIISILNSKEARVSFHDPYAKSVRVNGGSLRSTALTGANLKKNDITVIVTDHTDVDYELILKNARLIVDTRNALAPYKKNKKVITL